MWPLNNSSRSSTKRGCSTRPTRSPSRAILEKSPSLPPSGARCGICSAYWGPAGPGGGAGAAGAGTGAEAPGELRGHRLGQPAWVADLLITGRGGGSMEGSLGLQRRGRGPYHLASEIPVISAVGPWARRDHCGFCGGSPGGHPSNAWSWRCRIRTSAMAGWSRWKAVWPGQWAAY